MKFRFNGPSHELRVGEDVYHPGDEFDSDEEVVHPEIEKVGDVPSNSVVAETPSGGTRSWTTSEPSTPRSDS